MSTKRAAAARGMWGVKDKKTNGLLCDVFLSKLDALCFLDCVGMPKRWVVVPVRLVETVKRRK